MQRRLCRGSAENWCYRFLSIVGTGENQLNVLENIAQRMVCHKDWDIHDQQVVQYLLLNNTPRDLEALMAQLDDPYINSDVLEETYSGTLEYVQLGGIFGGVGQSVVDYDRISEFDFQLTERLVRILGRYSDAGYFSVRILQNSTPLALTLSAGDGISCHDLRWSQGLEFAVEIVGVTLLLSCIATL